MNDDLLAILESLGRVEQTVREIGHRTMALLFQDVRNARERRRLLRQVDAHIRGDCVCQLLGELERELADVEEDRPEERRRHRLRVHDDVEQERLRLGSPSDAGHTARRERARWEDEPATA